MSPPLVSSNHTNNKKSTKEHVHEKDKEKPVVVEDQNQNQSSNQNQNQYQDPEDISKEKKRVHFSIPPGLEESENKDSKYFTFDGETKINIPHESGLKSPLISPYLFYELIKITLFYILAITLFMFLIPLYIGSLVLRQIVKFMFFTFYPENSYRLVNPGISTMSGCENHSSSSNICLNLKCEGQPSIDKLMDVFEKKVLDFRTNLRYSKSIDDDSGEKYYQPYERLKWILVEKFLFFCWKRDRHFCLRNHIHLDEIGEKVDLKERVLELSEFYLGLKLPQNKPQWEISIVSKKNNGVGSIPIYYIVFVIHHSYTDAMSLLQLLKYGLADKPFKLTLDPMSLPKDSTTTRYEKIPKWKKYLLIPVQFTNHIVQMLQEGNIFHGPYAKGQKTCKWSTKLTLEQFKSVKFDQNGDENSNTRKPSFTAVMSSCISQAFTRSYIDARARIPLKINAGVPYTQLPYEDLKLVNKFSMSLLHLPTSTLERSSRLEKCQKYSTQAANPHYSEINHLLSKICGSLIVPCMKQLSLFARTTISYSNIPGPREKFTILNGHTVLDIIIFPPMKFRCGVVIGSISYNGHVNISFSADEFILAKSPRFPFKFLKYLEMELCTLSHSTPVEPEEPLKMDENTCISSLTSSSQITQNIFKESPFLHRKLPEIHNTSSLVSQLENKLTRESGGSDKISRDLYYV